LPTDTQAIRFYECDCLAAVFEFLAVPTTAAAYSDDSWWQRIGYNSCNTVYTKIVEYYLLWRTEALGCPGPIPLLEKNSLFLPKFLMTFFSHLHQNLYLHKGFGNFDKHCWIICYPPRLDARGRCTLRTPSARHWLLPCGNIC